MSSERYVVADDGKYVYFVPGEMTPNGDKDNGRIDFFNVWTGLQWYKAYTNTVEGMTDKEKTDLILEIFKEENDLLSLAREVEIQSGVSGLIKSVLESYTWADWRMSTRAQNVTEVKNTGHTVDFAVSLGEQKLTALSMLQKTTPSGIKYMGLFHKELLLYRNGEEITYNEDIDEVLPTFDTRSVSVLPGRKIKFEGVDEFEDADSLKDGRREFFAFILNLDGKVESDVSTKLDPVLELRDHFLVTKKELNHVLADAGAFDLEEMKKNMRGKQLAKEALVRFLLPYCDAPTTDGHFYIPDEASIKID